MSYVAYRDLNLEARELATLAHALGVYESLLGVQNGMLGGLEIHEELDAAQGLGQKVRAAWAEAKAEIAAEQEVDRQAWEHSPLNPRRRTSQDG